MIDTHCHIDFEEYDKDRDEIIKRAQDKLDAVIVSGIGYESNQGVLDLSVLRLSSGLFTELQ